MRTNLYFVAFIIIASMSLISCASSEESLKRVTAVEIGNTRTNDVTVYNIDRGVSTVNWKAKAPSGCYECDADDMVRNVHCVKIECDSLTSNQ